MWPRRLFGTMERCSVALDACRALANRVSAFFCCESRFFAVFGFFGVVTPRLSRVFKFFFVIPCASLSCFWIFFVCTDRLSHVFGLFLVIRTLVRRFPIFCGCDGLLVSCFLILFRLFRTLRRFCRRSVNIFVCEEACQDFCV